MKVNENVCVVLPSCVLVPYREKHVLKYHEWMKSEELQLLTASEPLTLQEEYDMQKSWHQDDKKCTFIVLDRVKYNMNGANEIAAMVGDVNLFFNDSDCDSSAEVEIMIAEASARGKGLGRQATLAMMYYGITSLGVTVFTAKIGYSNEKSISLFSSLHFTEVSRSEAFQEVTLALKVTKEITSSISLSLGEYSLSTYSDK